MHKNCTVCLLCHTANIYTVVFCLQVPFQTFYTYTFSFDLISFHFLCGQVSPPKLLKNPSSASGSYAFQWSRSVSLSTIFFIISYRCSISKLFLLQSIYRKIPSAHSCCTDGIFMWAICQSLCLTANPGDRCLSDHADSEYS